MKYSPLSDKILRTIYEQNNEEIKQDKLLKVFPDEEKDLANSLQYLEKLNYIDIREPFSFAFVGCSSVLDNDDDEQEEKDSSTISLTQKGIKYCESSNLNSIKIPETSINKKEVNIFSKISFLSKNNIKDATITKSDSFIEKIFSFFKNILN